MAKLISELSKTLTEDQLVDYVGTILEEKIDRILTKKVKLRDLTSAKLREMQKAGITGPELEAMKTRVSSLKSKIKKLKRGLGGVILTNPEHYKKTGLFKRILSGKDKSLNNILTNDNWFHELDSALGSWDNTLHSTGPSNLINPEGKVGHHRTALSVMRDALLEQPDGIRARFKELALADGYQVGEEFVDYIDPVAHKGLNDKIHGMLKNKGYLKKSDPRINKDVMKELIERSAHSNLFGSTKGYNFPKELIAKNASAEDIYKAARPYLEMNRMAAEQGLAFDKIVTEGKWDTPEELLDLVKNNAEIDVKKTEALVNRMNLDLYNAGHVDATGYNKIKNKVDQWGAKRAQLVKDPVSLGQTIEDIQKPGASWYAPGEMVPEEVIENAKKVGFRSAAANRFKNLDPTKLAKASTGLSSADSLAQIAAGNYLGGGLGLAMNTPAFRKAIAARFAKAGSKLIPGVGIGMSGLEMAGYASQGRFTQAGIAALSGAIGEIPVIGDIGAGILDLGNTAIDAFTGNLVPSADVDVPNRTGRQARRALAGVR